MNATQLKLEVETTETHAIASPVGRIDAMTSPGLQEDVDSLIDDGAKRLVMNLSNVPFVSSAGLRVFIHAAKRLMADGKFVVCGINENVMQVFELAGFDRLMTIVDSVEEAVQKVNE